MKFSHFLALALLIFFVSQKSARSSVWESEQEWDEQWELNYQTWVKSDAVNSLMFTKAGSYPGISVDCADVAYSLRAIFAYEHKLPFMVKNPVARKDSKIQFFSNKLSYWDKFEEKKRVISVS